jgi:hypothetical protein
MTEATRKEESTGSNPSLRVWLWNELTTILSWKTASPPLVIWCDPDREWRDLLLAASEGGAFELWADEKHELILREELRTAPARPRVVWVPRRREDLSFLKLFELQAEKV